MGKIIEDVTLLTGVPEGIIKKLIRIEDYAIAHLIYESIRENRDIISVDIGIGELQIKTSDNEVKYKFVPSAELNELVTKTIVTGQSPVAIQLESNLQEKINKAYKELL